LESAYWFLEAGDHTFKTVVIDTVTNVQDLAIRHVMQEHKKDEADAGGWGSMTKAMWGEVSSMLKTWLTNFRNLPMNVVFLAQERVFNAGDDENEDGQLAPEAGPRLMPSIVSHINAAVDLIGNSFIREKIKRKKVDGKVEEERTVQYCLRIGPHGYYVTKVRKPKDVEIPAFLVDPTYEDILELRNGG
jgi:hypothetical protein